MQNSKWKEYKEKKSAEININPVEKKDTEIKNVLNKFDESDFMEINFNKISLAPGIWVYRNVFKDSEKLVDDINEHFGSGFHDGQVFSAETDRETNKKSRDCSVVVINQSNDEGKKEVYDLIRKSMLTCLRDYCRMHGVSINELTGDQWQVLKYGHQQHFEGHADDGFRFPRTVSITAYLNDNYTGGEVEYKHFNLLYKPQAGDVLVFPSNYVYNHKVIPVETGIRYALVNWFRWCTMKVDMLQQ